MADGVAVLGLQVDASGALVELKKFDDATKKTGDTATKTQAQVAGMAGGFKAVDGTVLSSYEALRKYEAALNRAANVGRRAEQMARELALAEQAQAAAAAQATAATAAAEPPEDPPGTRSRSTGFLVGPYALFSVDDPIANSSMFVLPITMQPMRPAIPALMWTTVPPAKSSAPMPHSRP